jgi:hypothetical protein
MLKPAAGGMAMDLREPVADRMISATAKAPIITAMSETPACRSMVPKV